MNTLIRRLSALTAALLLLAATGCHFDHGHYRVHYASGYECSPHFHAEWRVIDGHPSRYHAPCDGIRTHVHNTHVSGYRYRRVSCP